jgi:hypothetical protein
VQAAVGIERSEGGVLHVLDFFKELDNILGNGNLFGHDAYGLKG